MATKISELTTATTLDGSELLPIVQGGVTKQTSVTDLVSGGELPAYSTSETLTTERWTDGKPIYRIVVNHAFGAIDTTVYSPAIPNVDKIVDWQVDVTDIGGTHSGVKGYYGAPSATDYYYFVLMTPDNKARAEAKHTSWVNQPIDYIVYYTKTTDTAASPVAGVTVTDSAVAFRAVMSSAQTLLANTWTKINFGSVEFDTNSDFDLGNDIFQPSVAGYYHVKGTARIDPVGNSTQFHVSINDQADATLIVSFEHYASSSLARSQSASIVRYFNGTTDSVYFQGYMGSTSGALNIGSSSTIFEAFRIGA